ncbi:MAG: glutathione-dependent formaldehyde-activating [Phenylobacterium sp.]|nr:glutathione-dependent formaldehyde-activating [Phenylobacterium sp.]
MTAQLAGHCHCRAVRVILEPSKPAAELPLRACQCSFCRTRGALTTSDPAGHLFVEAAPGSLNRYRFGLRVTDFLLCAECGTYVAAVSDIAGRAMGVLNVRGVDLSGFEGREPDPMIYDDETADQRLARRQGRWMPVSVVEVQPSI